VNMTPAVAMTATISFFISSLSRNEPPLGGVSTAFFGILSGHS